jgi:hypothetical protein
VAPVQQGRRPQPPHRLAPLRGELRIRRTEAQPDPPAVATAERNGRIGVGHQLRDDLDEIDSALGEVLAEVAAVDAAVPDQGRVELPRHAPRILWLDPVRPGLWSTAAPLD